MQTSSVSTATADEPKKKKKSHLGAILGGERLQHHRCCRCTAENECRLRRLAATLFRCAGGAIGGGMGGIVLVVAAYFLLRKKSATGTYTVGNPTYNATGTFSEAFKTCLPTYCTFSAEHAPITLLPPASVQATRPPRLRWAPAALPRAVSTRSWKRCGFASLTCLSAAPLHSRNLFSSAVQVVEQTGTPRSARRRAVTPFTSADVS